MAPGTPAERTRTRNRSAEARAQVAQAQPETFGAIREELAVLRDQHAVQQRPLHSG